jgi:predicted nucleotide-binding protein (sugar kinase/HSP70/actin superfamily)
MARKIKETHPNANIVAIDYDPGATKVNQENRIKLMLANARLPKQENSKATVN